MRLLSTLLLSLMSSAAFAQDCVVLLHGLARSDVSFLLMEETLAKVDYAVVNDSYP